MIALYKQKRCLNSLWRFDMKCIKDIKSGKIIRINDDIAKVLILKKEAVYTTKSAWRKQEKKK